MVATCSKPTRVNNNIIHVLGFFFFGLNQMKHCFIINFTFACKAIINHQRLETYRNFHIATKFTVSSVLYNCFLDDYVVTMVTHYIVGPSWTSGSLWWKQQCPVYWDVHCEWSKNGILHILFPFIMEILLFDKTYVSSTYALYLVLLITKAFSFMNLFILNNFQILLKFMN